MPIEIGDQTLNVNVYGSSYTTEVKISWEMGNCQLIRMGIEQNGIPANTFLAIGLAPMKQTFPTIDFWELIF